MSWNEVTLTESGERLLASMLNGSKLTFTRAVLGSSTVEEEMMPMLTDISSPISAPALISGKKELESGNGTAILIQIRNEGVSETTRMRQIGVFAKSEHNDEVMFGVLQDDIGEEIPAYADFPQFEISLDVALAISRTNNIEVIVSPLVYAKQSDLEALKKSCEESFAEIAQAGADGIATHNTDPNAHAAVSYQIKGIKDRMRAIEIAVGIEELANPFAVTFGNLDGITANAVWNADEARLEF